MTVAALPSTITYSGNGETVLFAVPFRFKAPEDLVATTVAPDGTATVLAYGVDYTAAGGDTDAGGVLTVTYPVPLGVHLEVQRATPRAQPMVYTNYDRFPAKSHEEALDRAMLIAQEEGAERDRLDRRALKIRRGLTAPDLLPIPGVTSIVTIAPSGQAAVISQRLLGVVPVGGDFIGGPWDATEQGDPFIGGAWNG